MLKILKNTELTFFRLTREKNLDLNINLSASNFKNFPSLWQKSTCQQNLFLLFLLLAKHDLATEFTLNTAIYEIVSMGLEKYTLRH
jgi:hypothetical protein